MKTLLLTAVRGVLSIGVLLGIVWFLFHDFSQGAQNNRVEAVYQKMADDPRMLPALAQVKVAALTCKFEMPQPLNLVIGKFQKHQPDAYRASMIAAQQNFDNMGDMTILACTMTKALLDEALRQATN